MYQALAKEDVLELGLVLAVAALTIEEIPLREGAIVVHHDIFALAFSSVLDVWRADQL